MYSIYIYIYKHKCVSILYIYRRFIQLFMMYHGDNVLCNRSLNRIVTVRGWSIYLDVCVDLEAWSVWLGKGSKKPSQLQCNCRI